MVFVWSQFTKGDANCTLVQVSVNDLIMVVAFAPNVAFLLGVCRQDMRDLARQQRADRA